MRYHRLPLGFILYIGPYSLTIDLDATMWHWNAGHNQMLTVIDAGPVTFIYWTGRKPF